MTATGGYTKLIWLKESAAAYMSKVLLLDRYSPGGTICAAIFLSIISAFGTQAEAAKGSPHFAQLDGIRVHYTNYGKGPSARSSGAASDFALILIHGWNCDESVWKGQVAALSRKTRVLTIDLPGHGQSDKPEIAYTMDLHARAIDAVMHDAQVASAVLIGHSNGTPVVRQFYRRFRDKVRGLIIVDGALRPFGDQAMMEKFIAPLRGRDYEQTAVRFINGMIAPVKSEAERAEIKTMMMKTPQHVAVSEMEGLMDAALWETDQIEVPVLMVLAKQPAWTPEYEDFARMLVPQLDYQMWEGVSHFIMMDEPEKFNAAVLAFLKKNKLAAK